MKRMKRDEPVDVIVPGSPVQYLPSSGELALEPSYNVTLSKRQSIAGSTDNCWNVADITYNRAAVSRKTVHLFHRECNVLNGRVISM